MRKKKYCKDYIDEAIAAGAYVLPPTASVEEASMEPVTTPPTEPIMTPDPPYRLVERKSVTEPPAEPSVEVEDAAKKLERHWKNLEQPGQPSVAAESPDFAKYTHNQVKADIGEVVDCEVSDRHDAVGTGVGFAFILPKSERRGALYIRESDVISTGKIHLGTFIRCEVAPPSGVNRCFEGTRIEIYQEEQN